MDNNIDIISSINYTAGNILDQTKKAAQQQGAIEDIADTSIKADNAAVINAALKADAVDMEAVNAAKLLLAEGLLDSDENIASAANRIAELGI
jgi:hypothetical protein